MEFEKGCYYMTRTKFKNFAIDIHCFLCNELIIENYYDVYGYQINNMEFVSEYYLWKNQTYCEEISIEKAMELFPDNDIKKINYLRKQKIKSLIYGKG